MIVTKQLLQQLIDEEFSRALEERRQRKLRESFPVLSSEPVPFATVRDMWLDKAEGLAPDEVDFDLHDRIIDDIAGELNADRDQIADMIVDWGQATSMAPMREAAHEVGDTVVSNTNHQGLKSGQQYTVVDVEHGPFGTVMYGVQPVSGGEQLWIANGHLLLEPVQ